MYATPGSGGPECKVCNEKDHYFDVIEGVCERCPSSVVSSSIFIGVLLLLLVIFFALRCVIRRFLRNFVIWLLDVGIPCKGKITYIFLQIAVAFGACLRLNPRTRTTPCHLWPLVRAQGCLN